MKVLVATDSFKGTLSAVQAAQVICSSFQEVFPDCVTDAAPVADGGEGTVDAVIGAMQGKKQFLRVTAPLGNSVEAFYGTFGDTAIIEMAAASGILLADEKVPMEATSYGTGELIADALKRNFKNLCIAIGGSATNDCGIGMLRALGYRFLDARGAEIGCGAKDLEHIAFVDAAGRMEELAGCIITVLCDVKNPLLGEQGATYVYGGQKGIQGELYARVEAGMAHFADVAERHCGLRCREDAGMGAAGGMGFALKAFLDAEIRSGIETVLDLIGIDERIKSADLVVTGEGMTDGQSAFGKAPAGVGNRAKKQNVPVVLISGALDDGFEQIYAEGVEVVVPCIDRLSGFDYVKLHAAAQLNRTAARVAKLIDIGYRMRG